MFTGRSALLVQIYNKNNTVDSKITKSCLAVSELERGTEV